MFTISNELAGRVARRHGIITKDELLADGVTDSAIRRLVTARSLIRTHQGVYRVATTEDSFEARCVAACLADSSVVVTGAAAARLWSFRHVFLPDEPIVLVEHDRSPLQRGVLLRRTNVLEPTDWVARPDSIRVANPARAWFDCARDINDERFENLTEWVLDRHTTVPTLWGMLRRMTARGRPGLARAHRVLSQREVWQKPVGSALELKVIRALQDRGVCGIVRQHPIRCPNGIVVHPDAALPAIRWALEVDHVTWHGGRMDAQRDKGRDRQLRRVGWQVDRVTDQEIRDDLAAAANEIVALINLRRTEFAAATPRIA